MLPVIPELLEDFAFWASQEVQSNHAALTLLLPTLTYFANGMIATRMSPALPAAFCSAVSISLAAVLSAGILPSDAIEPVLSSASAICILLRPQRAWASTPTLMDGTPI